MTMELVDGGGLFARCERRMLRLPSAKVCVFQGAEGEILPFRSSRGLDTSGRRKLIEPDGVNIDCLIRRFKR